MEFTIDAMRRQDWRQVRDIYREGLATGLAAFMTDPPRWAAWNAGHLETGRLVARGSGGPQPAHAEILGWAALAPVPDT